LSCSTKATAADPKHAACSPKPTPPRTPSPSSSTSTATHPVRSYTHSPPKQQQPHGKREPRPCSSETQARPCRRQGVGEGPRRPLRHVQRLRECPCERG